MKFLRIMGACFLVAGVAVLVAVPMLWVMSVIWIAVGVFLIVLAQKFASAEANRLRLLATGKAGNATILEVTDTGVTINNNPRVRLRVRIEVAGELPFEATHAMTVSRLHVPSVGEVYDVRFDPKDPNNFAFAQRSAAGTGGSEHVDTISRLERLAALRASGALTAEEFQQQKRKLLGEAH